MRTFVGEPVCFECKRFVCAFDNWHCDAFPAGIPDEIRHGKLDHTTPVEGDSGILFERGEPTYL